MKPAVITAILFLVLSSAAFAGEATPKKETPFDWLDKPPEDAITIVMQKRDIIVDGKRCTRMDFLVHEITKQVRLNPFIDKEKKASALSVIIKPEVGVIWARMQMIFFVLGSNGIYRIYLQTGPDTVRRIFLPVSGLLRPAGTDVPDVPSVLIDKNDPNKLTIIVGKSKDETDLDNFKKIWNKFDGRYEGTIHAPQGLKGKDLLKVVRAMKKAGCRKIYYSLKSTGTKFEQKELEYDPDLERAIFRTPRILAGKIVEKPIIMLEDEVEITRDIPRGTSFDRRTGRKISAEQKIREKFYGNRWYKKEYLEKEGGSKSTEAAVLAGLLWLAKHQSEDGRWTTVDYQKKCDSSAGVCPHGANESSLSGSNFDTGLTGLGVLAYLGVGNTHRSGKFKKNVDKALKFLLSQQDRKSGIIGHSKGESWVYNHMIATYALCEAYALTKDAALKVPAQKAVDYILEAQNPGYGWKYEPKDAKNDSSVTAWAVYALHAAKMAKLNVTDSAFEDALAWFDRVTRVSDGKVGYMRPRDCDARLAGCPPDDTYKKLPTMTAVAILARIHCGQKPANNKIQQGAKILMANLPDYNKPKKDKVNFYYWYFGTNAMFQVGGDGWKKWNESMKKALVDNQCKKGCAKGSWEPSGEWCIVGGRVYSTAMATLTLQTYYRYNRVIEQEKK